MQGKNDRVFSTEGNVMELLSTKERVQEAIDFLEGCKKEIPDKEISIMYERSFAYVGKLQKKWEREGKY